MPTNVVVLFDNPDGQAMIKQLCDKHGIRFSELRELVQVEIEYAGSRRRHGMRERFDDILDQIGESNP